MSSLVQTLRAVVREELTRYRMPELGTVTKAFAKEDDSGDGNHQVNLTLRGSGVELQRVPVSVERAGWSALPREGDLVVVVFLAGDMNSAVVLGTVYSSKLRPPKAGPLEAVYQPPDEEDDAVRRLHVELPGGGTITLNDGKLKIVSGGTEVTLEKDGDVAVKSAGNVTIESQGDISLKADGNVSIEASQSLTLKGMSTTVEGQSSATLKGSSISIAGISSFSPS
jgi:phage baseplate assembly protein gpV